MDSKDSTHWNEKNLNEMNLKMNLNKTNKWTNPFDELIQKIWVSPSQSPPIVIIFAIPISDTNYTQEWNIPP